MMSKTKKPAAKIKFKPAKSPRKKRIVSPLPFEFKALDGKPYTLTPKQKSWCDIYLEEGANLTIASLETYKVTNKHLCRTSWRSLTDKEKKNRTAAENTAAQIGRENLRKPQIRKYIEKVLEDESYTDGVVNLEHFKNIKQNKNLSAKNTAIDMYYRKKDKYAPEKKEHTGKGGGPIKHKHDMPMFEGWLARKIKKLSTTSQKKKKRKMGRRGNK